MGRGLGPREGAGGESLGSLIRVLEPREVLAADAPLPLGADEVHAWAFALEADAAIHARCGALLDAGERDRAGRFHFDVHRDRFVLAHGLVRHVLARYAGTDPRALVFKTAAQGKPALEGLAGVSFNLSHSHERGLLAVSANRDLGADVEHERDEVDMLGIAGSYFFRSELESIRSAADPAELRRRFFRYWTAKESALKAQGCGLGFPLDKFEVVFEANGETARANSFDIERMAPGWTIKVLSLGPGWPAAIAAQGSEWTLNYLTADG